jgi:hypothetical protein
MWHICSDESDLEAGGWRFPKSDVTFFDVTFFYETDIEKHQPSGKNINAG